MPALQEWLEGMTQDRIRTADDWEAFFALFPWLEPNDWEERKGELPKRTTH